ncbi:MAG: MBL fold metallo-hydrolase [Acidobacteria bacterium]|nr:MBL fold metallo-hydrolase [Acidobacteriota bacterium]
MARYITALCGALVLVTAMVARPSAQAQTAQAVLQAVAQAQGTNTLKCVTYNGAGYVGMVGQAYDIRDDWPRVELANYSRTLNFEEKSSREERVIRQGSYPPRGGGGIPIQGEQRVVEFVVDRAAWTLQGANTMPVPAPAAAEMRQLDMWLNPHGFVKAAMAPGANPVLITRWESGALGGLSSVPMRRLRIISFTALGKYRVNGTINEQNLVERVQTWVPNPVRGDMNYEGEFSQWRDVSGIKFPGNFHHHQDWDDETQPPNYSGGHNRITFTVKDVMVNQCAATPVPEAARTATVPPVRVETTKMGDGVYYLTGGSHHSMAVEFRDFTALIEAPQDERRTLAVIEAVYKVIPNKPIRYVVNSHNHFDHLGGIRTAFHEGATIVTHHSNREFYKQEVLTYAARTLEPDRLSLYPPTEFAEGYQLETVDMRGTISDGTRNLDVYYVQGSPHAEGMLMAYLPKEKILVEADVYTPPAPDAQMPATPPPAALNLYNNVMNYKLDVATIAGLHGRAVPWSDFLRFVGKTGTN